MIILHENLQDEAKRIAKTLKRVYGVGSTLFMGNSELPLALFEVISVGGVDDAIKSTSLKARKRLKREFGDQRILVLTKKDTYDCRSSPRNINLLEDWMFGYSLGNLSVISTARVGSKSFPGNLYLRRLDLLAVGEIGWGVIKNPNFQEASWISNQGRNVMELGPHCTDRTCAMYPVVDIQSPSRQEGYLLIGKQRKYDAGLDDLAGRLSPGFLCDTCRGSIHVGKSYK